MSFYSVFLCILRLNQCTAKCNRQKVDTVYISRSTKSLHYESLRFFLPILSIFKRVYKPPTLPKTLSFPRNSYLLALLFHLQVKGADLWILPLGRKRRPKITSLVTTLPLSPSLVPIDLNSCEREIEINLNYSLFRCISTCHSHQPSLCHDKYKKTSIKKHWQKHMICRCADY